MEELIRDAIKKESPKKRRVLRWVFIGISVISGIVTLIKTSEDRGVSVDDINAPTAITTGDNSTATVQIKNDLATYLWTNEKKWIETLQETNPTRVNKNASYKANLKYNSTEGILPSRLCLKYSSDGLITTFATFGITEGNCVISPRKDLEVEVFFQIKPTTLTSEIIN